MPRNMEDKTYEKQQQNLQKNTQAMAKLYLINFKTVKLVC